VESCGGVLSIVDMVAQRRDGSRWQRELDDDDDFDRTFFRPETALTLDGSRVNDP